MKLTKRLGAVLMLAMLVLAMSMSASAAKAKINKKSQRIGVGESFTLKIKNAKGKTTWSSSDATVAKVTKKGKVTGLKGGSATITAKNNKKNYKCAVTVEEVKFEGVTSPIELAVGGSYDLGSFAKSYPSASGLAWTSDKPAVAEVTEKGKITAKGAGEATITAQIKDGKASATVKVNVKVAAEEKKDNPNIVVINDDNFDSEFDKYFGRVVISTYYLDANGNLLNPENYVHETVRTKLEADVTKKRNTEGQWADYTSLITDEVAYLPAGEYWAGSNGDIPMVSQKYAYYVKDGSISDLMTYGTANLQYHVNTYEVNVAGSRPIFAKLVKSEPLGFDTIPTGNFGTVKINTSEKVSLARMFFPKATTTTIYYDYRTQHQGKFKAAKGSKVVEYSVQGIDGKAMLGFDFATVNFAWNQDVWNDNLMAGTQYSVEKFNQDTDVLEKVYMVKLEDDMFRFVDFHLYKKR